MNVRNILNWILITTIGLPMLVGALVYPWSGMSSFTAGKTYIILHYIVILTVTYFAISQRLKISLFSKMFLVLLGAFVLHHLIFWINAKKILFELGMLNLLYSYFTLVFWGAIGGLFGKTYIDKYRKAKVYKTGIDALAYVESFQDTNARFSEGVHKQYKVKLTLRIENHPRSPYTVEDIFYVSEFNIHLLSGVNPVAVRVDKRNHKEIALNLGWVK